MPKTLLFALLLALAAVAVPAASADPDPQCFTVGGTGPCVSTGESGTGPGVSPTGGIVCWNDYCPTLGSQPYNCLVVVQGKGALHMNVCVGIPALT